MGKDKQRQDEEEEGREKYNEKGLSGGEREGEEVEVEGEQWSETS